MLDITCDVFADLFFNLFNFFGNIVYLAKIYTCHCMFSWQVGAMSHGKIDQDYVEDYLSSKIDSTAYLF